MKSRNQPGVRYVHRAFSPTGPICGFIAPGENMSLTWQHVTCLDCKACR